MSFKYKIQSKYIVSEVEDDEAKAAPPSPSMKKKTYYHGTPTEQQAKKIWVEGIKPDLVEDEGQISVPVKGRVYCTSNLGYAVIYALGGDIAGTPFNKDFEPDYGKYGYLFVIKGDQFKDIHPDEDQVGEAIHDKKFPWLTKLAEKHLSDEEESDPDGCMTGSLLKDVYQGCYTCWIKSGKLLLPYLTDNQKLQIIRKYGNVAHEGVLHPSEMWKIDRSKTKLLKKDGSNFFKIATLVKKR